MIINPPVYTPHSPQMGGLNGHVSPQMGAGGRKLGARGKEKGLRNRRKKKILIE